MTNESPPKKRVLFVDDDVSLLSALRRQLRKYSSDWDLHFAESGAEALAILEHEHLDVIVSDLMMPVMSGQQLLRVCRDKYPSMVRLVFSGTADSRKIHELGELVAGIVIKPSDPDMVLALAGMKTLGVRPQSQAAQQTAAADRSSVRVNDLIDTAMRLTEAIWRNVAQIDMELDLAAPPVMASRSRLLAVFVASLVYCGQVLAREARELSLIRIRTVAMPEGVEVRVMARPLKLDLDLQDKLGRAEMGSISGELTWMDEAHHTIVGTHGGQFRWEHDGGGTTFIFKLMAG